MIYFLFLLITLAVLYFSFYQWQFYMLFSPTFHRDKKLKKGTSFLSIITDDGNELEGIISEPDEIKNTLLFFSGKNHDVVGLINKLSEAYPFSRVISFNYRSYGKSKGKVSEKNILSDGLKIAELVEKNYGNFFLLGYSLGSNIATYIASKRNVKALLLIGAFDSIASLSKLKYIDKLFRYKFPTGEYIQNVDADTYLFMSRSDETTYVENARLLQMNVKNLVFSIELDNLDHGEILWDSEVTSKINEIINVENSSF